MTQKKAFTLVELIVVITILAILGLISFVGLQGYSREARDSKRLTDVRNLLSKVTVEEIKGRKYEDLIISTSPNNVWINGEYTKSYPGTVNFKMLMENASDFKDPSDSTLDYPIAYSYGGIGTGTYKFTQIATISETNNKARVEGNYYKMNPEKDSDSLFVDEEGGENKVVIVDGGSILPYYPSDESMGEKPGGGTGGIPGTGANTGGAGGGNGNSGGGDNDEEEGDNQNPGGEEEQTGVDENYTPPETIPDDSNAEYTYSTFSGCDTRDIIISGIVGGETKTYIIAACNLGAKYAGLISGKCGTSTWSISKSINTSNGEGCSTDNLGKYYQWGVSNGFILEQAPTGFVSSLTGGATDVWPDNPCGEGYHIPSSTEWTELYTIGNWGSDYNQMSKDLLLPFAGFRAEGSTSGYIREIGIYGSYWSNNGNAVNGVNLRFDNYDKKMIYPANGSKRGRGLPIRCFKNIE